jgi:hypothetical protein
MGLRPLYTTDIPELTLDLDLDVEGRLSSGDATLVSRNHELADLLAEGGILPLALVEARSRIDREQAADLALHVDPLFPAADPPFVSSLNELADLGFALDFREGAARSRSGPRGAVVDREVSAPELVEQAEGACKQNRCNWRDHKHHDPDQGAEIHALSVADGPRISARQMATQVAALVGFDRPISRLAARLPPATVSVPDKET